MTPSRASKDQPQWTDDCEWPRRLLHIRSMKSYPWKPGNKYGGYREPGYNAISYTWGRFCFKPADPEYLTTRPLSIKGVSWPIPRVKPSHFTAEQLHHIIKSAAYPSLDDGLEEVEFVWLDIACIDQTYPRTTDYYREVGRQAKIFRGANEVIIWLTKLDAQRMGNWWTGMKRVEAPVIGVEVGNNLDADLDEWIDRVRQYLDEMRSDPWFTSLWTLQEAFLCPYAILMCKEGLHRDQFGQGNMHVGSAHLKDIVYRWHDVLRRFKNLRRANNLYGAPLNPVELTSLEAAINNLGFLEAARLDAHYFQYLEADQPLGYRTMGNPLLLLKASNQRQCREETDRVRGIMQVFDLQLGESSPAAIPGKSYTLAELEDELGSELLRRYPISSQLMVQSLPCPPRKLWRVSSRMTLMESLHSFWRQKLEPGGLSDEEQQIISSSRGASLSPEEFEGTVMVRFEGRYSLLSTFIRVVHQFLGPNSIHLQLEQKSQKAVNSSGMEEPETVADQLNRLADHFCHDKIGILFLARIRPPSKENLGDNIWCDWGVGLILCQENGREEVYERLGVLIWDMYAIQELMNMNDWQLGTTDVIPNGYNYVNSAYGPGWTSLSGHFG